MTEVYAFTIIYTHAFKDPDRNSLLPFFKANLK